MIPNVWAESTNFAASSIFIKGHWVTLVNWQTDTEPPVAALARLGFRRTEKVRQFGTRQILRTDDWLTLDKASEIVPFNSSTVYVAAGELPALQPDHSALLRYAVRTAFSNPDRFSEISGDIAADDFFDLIRLGEIAQDNANAWHRLLVAYCARAGGDPDEIDLMRDVAHAVATCRGVPIETVLIEHSEPSAQEGAAWEPVAILEAGACVIVSNGDGSERRAKLARTVYSDAATVAIYQPDPLWIAGVPVHDYEETARELVRIDDGRPLKQNSPVFGHPVAIESDEYAYLLGRGSDALTPKTEADEEAMPASVKAIRALVDERLSAAGIADYAVVAPHLSAGVVHWRLLFRVGTAYELHRFTVPPASEEPHHENYLTLLQEIETTIETHARSVELELKNASQWGISFDRFDGLFSTMDLLKDDEQRRSIARAVAAGGYTSGTVRKKIFDSKYAAEYALPLKIELPLDNGSDDTLQFRQGSDGSLYLWNRSAGSALDVMLGIVPYAKGETYQAAAAAWLQMQFGELQQRYANVLVAAQALDLVETENDPLPLNARIVALSENILARFLVSPGFSACTESWRERYADGVAKAMVHKGDAAELIVLGINKRKVTKEQMSGAELWKIFVGNRQRALDHLTGKVRQSRGFRTAEIIQLDRLAILNPELLREVSSLYDHGMVARSEASEDAEARSDTGIVRGYARKHLYSMRKEDLAEALTEMGESALVDFVRASKIWPRPDWDSLREGGMSPELAFLVDLTRQSLPSQFRSIVGNAPIVAVWVDAVRGVRQALEAASDLDSGLLAVAHFVDEVGAVKINEDGSKTKYWAPMLIDSLRPTWSRSARRAYFSITDANLGSYVVGAVQRQGAWTMIQEGKTGATQSQARHSLADLPPLAHIERIGPNWRDNRNITEEDLLRTFAFTGVEYGNWTSQKERAAYMNFAFDSFCDLADLTGLPRTALSLGGQLGLTFGSRGRGGRNAALAHYESANKALALTRKKGAGSLAHEFFHGLANYFGVQHSAGVSSDLAVIVHNIIERGAWMAGGDMEARYAGAMRPEACRAFAQLLWALTRSPANNDWSTINTSSDITFAALPNVAAWVQSSEKLDTSEKRRTPYWSNAQELFARGMEAWTVYRLSAADRKNDYLIRDARISLNEVWEHAVYPSGDHLRVIALAADEFFATLKAEQRMTKNTIGDDVTLHLLYSRSGVYAPLSERIMADVAIAEVQRMLGDRAGLELRGALFDEHGNPVTGVYDRHQRLITAASHATIDVLRHESWHAAHDLLLTEDERQLMAEKFQSGTEEFEELQRVLIGMGRPDLARICRQEPLEAQAYAFELYTAGLLQLEGSSSRGLFAMVERFFEWVRDAINGYGFTQPAELFDALESGALLQRSYQQRSEVSMSSFA